MGLCRLFMKYNIHHLTTVAALTGHIKIFGVGGPNFYPYIAFEILSWLESIGMHFAFQKYTEKII